jgi:microcystin-dependent protein
MGISSAGSIPPAGKMSHFALSAAPAGWLKANGALVSRTTYVDLFNAIGTTFGAGDGSTTFALPDARAQFLRGFDDGKGTDTGRVLGSVQAGQNASHTHTASTDTAAAHSHTSPIDNTSIGASNAITAGGNSASANAASSLAGAHSHVVTVAANGGTEARPTNLATLICIKY